MGKEINPIKSNPALKRQKFDKVFKLNAVKLLQEKSMGSVSIDSNQLITNELYFLFLGILLKILVSNHVQA